MPGLLVNELRFEASLGNQTGVKLTPTRPADHQWTSAIYSNAARTICIHQVNEDAGIDVINARLMWVMLRFPWRSAVPVHRAAASTDIRMGSAGRVSREAAVAGGRMKKTSQGCTVLYCTGVPLGPPTSSRCSPQQWQDERVSGETLQWGNPNREGTLHLLDLPLVTTSNCSTAADRLIVVLEVHALDGWRQDLHVPHVGFS